MERPGSLLYIFPQAPVFHARWNDGQTTARTLLHKAHWPDSHPHESPQGHPVSPLDVQTSNGQ